MEAISNFAAPQPCDDGSGKGRCGDVPKVGPGTTADQPIVSDLCPCSIPGTHASNN